MIRSIPAAAQHVIITRLPPHFKPSSKTISISTAEIIESAKSARALGGRLLNLTLGLGDFGESMADKS